MGIVVFHKVISPKNKIINSRVNNTEDSYDRDSSQVLLKYFGSLRKHYH